MIRELLSALTPDFTMILWNGKLDRQAIQDCAAFLQAAIGRKRDRNANMWGILLYFMLQLNAMFQCDRDDQKQVFEWMVKSVTRSTYELNNHASVLEQFVLAVHNIQTTHANPLGREHETLFWHNYRTNCSPFVQLVSNDIKWYAFRLEAVICVIKNVLGRAFSAVEVLHMVNEASWATRGKAQFYDIMTNSWPIAHTVHEDTTNMSALVPLMEDDLLTNHVKEFRCIFIKQQKFNEIIRSVDHGSSVETAYDLIEIESSNPDMQGKYNFFEAVISLPLNEDSWFGYRALYNVSFGKYCGALNEMRIGTQTTALEIVREVAVANESAGFHSIQHLYQPATLLEYYGYAFPPVDSLPPGYKMLPFEMRNAENDLVIHNASPPWVRTESVTPHTDAREAEKLSPNIRSREDDEQSSGLGGPSPNRRNPGSNPLADATLGLNNSPNGPSADEEERPLKRRRARGLVLDEAEDEDGDNENVSLPNASHPHTKN